MSTVINKPDPVKNPEESFNNDLEFCELPLAFDFLEYQVGTKIAQPKDFQKDQMCLLAEGCIKVKIQSSLGESIIHEILPGDMFRLSSITGISSSDMGTASHFQTVIVADANTKIVRLKMIEIEKIFKTEPRLAYRLAQDMTRRWHEALQNMHAQCKTIRERFYSNTALAQR
jgi:CRP-like cAMP-binding protein